MAETTHPSLLLRVKDLSDAEAWRQFVALYRPMLLRYARAMGLDENDAEDVAQHCLTSITRHIESFEYDPTRGFRKWLRTMANNRVRQLWRKRREVQGATGDFNQPQEREPDQDEVWDRIYREERLNYGLQLVKQQVASKTYKAFQRTALDGCPVDQVSAELGMKRSRVYEAKSRVTKKLREIISQVLGDEE